MKRGIVLELRPKDKSFDFSRIMLDAANGRPVDLSSCTVHEHVLIVEEFRQEFIDHVIRCGWSRLIGRQTLSEDLVKPGTAPAAVQGMMQKFLGALPVTTDLVIVDPYFFAKIKDTSAAAAYPTLVEQVLSPVLQTLQQLTVVTLPTVDPALVAGVISQLNASAPNVTMSHKTSTAFHDRFWIDPIAAKGFLTGTSLNGLGRKYALIDHLEQGDATDVIAALKSEGLI